MRAQKQTILVSGWEAEMEPSSSEGVQHSRGRSVG